LPLPTSNFDALYCPTTGGIDIQHHRTVFACGRHIAPFKRVACEDRASASAAIPDVGVSTVILTLVIRHDHQPRPDQIEQFRAASAFPAMMEATNTVVPSKSARNSGMVSSRRQPATSRSPVNTILKAPN